MNHLDKYGWQAIESAPQDGTSVFVRGVADGVCISGNLLTIAHNNFNEDWCDEDVWYITEDTYSTPITPTHWKHLDSDDKLLQAAKVMMDALEKYAKPKTIVPYGVAANALKQVKEILG